MEIFRNKLEMPEEGVDISFEDDEKPEEEVVFEDVKLSPETLEAVEYIDQMRKDLAELEIHQSGYRDREKIDYLRGQVSLFEELGEEITGLVL